MANEKEILAKLNQDLNNFAKEEPAFMNTYLKLNQEVMKTEALDEKTKELMAIAIATYSRCKECIVKHISKAWQLKATKKEILESAKVAIVFGGGPTLAFIVGPVCDSLKNLTT